jgi:hypothetical protein
VSAPASPLDAVEALALARPFLPESVARTLGVAVAAVPERSTPFFVVHEGRGAAGAPFAEVELRTPRAAGKDGLVIAHLAGAVAVSKREVMDRFGLQPELAVPTPRQPPSSPLYFVYRFAWGDARFGFDRSGAELLRVVVLDATGAAP